MRAELASPLSPADLAQPRLFRYALITVSADRFFWFQRYSSLALDDYGRWLLARRVAGLYTSLMAGQHGAVPGFGRLAVLAAEAASYRSSAQHARDRNFWLSRFADRPDPLSLGSPLVTAPGRVQRRTGSLAEDSARALRAAARQAGLGWQRIVLAAAVAYLSRLSGVRDVVFGVTMAGRGSPAAKTTPTAVADVLPLRLVVSPGACISEVASQAAVEVRNMRRHQRFRSAELRRELDWPGDGRLDFGPEVNIMTTRPGLTFAGYPAVVHRLSFWSASDLSILVSGRVPGPDMEIGFTADTGLFGDAGLTAHHQGFLNFLSAAAAQPGLPVSQLDVLGPAQRRQIVRDWNDTAVPVPDQTLGELFTAQAARTPDAPAVAGEAGTWTYAQLDTISGRIAGYLAGLGAGPETIVAVAVPRSAEMVAALLGVVKTGAAYLPVDPDYPAERISFMLADARPAVLICTTAIAELLGPAAAGGVAGVRPVVLDDPATSAAIAACPASGPVAGPGWTAAGSSGVRDLHLRLDRYPQGRTGSGAERGFAHRGRRSAVRLRPGRRVDLVSLLRVRLLGVGDVGRAAAGWQRCRGAVSGEPHTSRVPPAARGRTRHRAQPDPIGVLPADAGRGGRSSDGRRPGAPLCDFRRRGTGPGTAGRLVPAARRRFAGAGQHVWHHRDNGARDLCRAGPGAGCFRRGQPRRPATG